MWTDRGEAGRCTIVAEIGQAHDGSLGTAHAYVDAVARTGADAIKFQTHIAAAESTPAEPWRVKFSRQDASRYDYWKRMEFTEPQWVELRAHADEAGLAFLSSPFSIESVALLERVGVAAWKIASGEVGNVGLLGRVAEDGRPVILSSGMSPMDELDRAVKIFTDRSIDTTVLQCTSAYPCPPEKVGLNVIPQLRERYGCKVGLSDHSGTIFAGIAAATVGIDLLEVHVTTSREAFGPDVPASITTDELRTLVQGVRFVETARANPVDKDGMAGELGPLRDLFTKSIVAVANLPAGTVLGPGHLAVKKPGTGMPAERLPELYGRQLARPVLADALIADDDLEPIP